MKLRLDADDLGPWAQVIAHLGSEYDFPATNFKELEFLLQKYTGDGSTFRIDREESMFVIDVIRRHDEILSILAISLVDKTASYERYGGAVIARACQIHPNDDEEDYVGSPLLKWYMVKRGGIGLQHCCDDECSGPDDITEAPELNWEACRLKVVQKVYEQEVLWLYRLADDRVEELKFQKKSSENRREEVAKVKEKLREAIKEGREAKDKAQNAKQQLHHATYEARLAKERVEKAEEGVQRGKEKANKAKGEFKELHRQFCNLKQQKDVVETKLFKSRTEVAESLRTSEAHIKEIEALRMRISSLNKENNAKDAIIRNLRTEIQTIHQQGAKTQNSEMELEKLQKQFHCLEKKSDDYAQRLHWSTSEIYELKAAKTDLESQIHTASKNHSQERMILQYEVQDLRKRNEDLNNGCKDLLEQKAAFQFQIMSTDEQAQEADTKLSKLQAEMSLKNGEAQRVKAQLESARLQIQDIHRRHVEELDELRREIQTKAVLTQQPQQDWPFHDSSNGLPISSCAIETLGRPADSAGDFAAQQAALHEAQERTTYLENQVKELKQIMKDKTNEVAALEKSRDDKLKCADREAYTAALEKELEEVRGTLEGIIGRVSTHQGRKRRRIEGPEDQVEGSVGF